MNQVNDDSFLLAAPANTCIDAVMRQEFDTIQKQKANANAVLIAHAPELARLLIRLNDAYEADPAELKDIASEIRPMLKKIGAI